MNVDRAVLTMAGTLVLAGTVLAALVSPWWLLLTGFVGLNLLQSSITGLCPAATLLARAGLPVGCAFEVSRASEVSDASARSGAGAR